MGGPAIDQFAKLPVIMWPLITIFIGGCESLRISKGWSNPNEPDHVFQKLLPEYVPGDIGFDPLGLKPTDPEEFRIMQTKELQNPHLYTLGHVPAVPSPDLDAAGQDERTDEPHATHRLGSRTVSESA